MRGPILTQGEREAVTQAVTEAEAGTDAEIVTIVAPRSDPYHDIGLNLGIVAMLLVAGIAALNPTAIEDKIAWFQNGWQGGINLGRSFFALMVAEAIVFLVVRFALTWTPLRLALTPKAVRSRRVRRRAIQYFKVGAERRTAARVGVLLYLSLDERLAEIIADQAIHARVAPERWGEAMAALIDRVREGHPGDGMAAAVTAIGAIVAEHFPKTESDVNELPDRLIEL
ncbi:MAG: TPM domain-containing protein [Sphingomonas sp.]|uniref:TPM domain-containing protein n=1 Tax=Sphingomonas sp. TaxID=28214 RepID=UPI003F7F24CC